MTSLRAITDESKFSLGLLENHFRGITVDSHLKMISMVEKMAIDEKVEDVGRANVKWVLSALNSHARLKQFVQSLTESGPGSLVGTKAKKLLVELGLVNALEEEIIRLSEIMYPGWFFNDLPLKTREAIERLAKENMKKS